MKTHKCALLLGLGYILGDIVEVPLYPLKPGVSRGQPGLSGEAPPPVIRPLLKMALYRRTVFQQHVFTYFRRLKRKREIYLH